jgi:hypothetical protein
MPRKKTTKRRIFDWLPKKDPSIPSSSIAERKTDEFLFFLPMDVADKGLPLVEEHLFL